MRKTCLLLIKKLKNYMDVRTTILSGQQSNIITEIVNSLLVLRQFFIKWNADQRMCDEFFTNPPAAGSSAGLNFKFYQSTQCNWPYRMSGEIFRPEKSRNELFHREIFHFQFVPKSKQTKVYMLNNMFIVNLPIILFKGNPYLQIKKLDIGET